MSEPYYFTRSGLVLHNNNEAIIQYKMYILKLARAEVLNRMAELDKKMQHVTDASIIKKVNQEMLDILAIINETKSNDINNCLMSYEEIHNDLEKKYEVREQSKKIIVNIQPLIDDIKCMEYYSYIYLLQSYDNISTHIYKIGKSQQKCTDCILRRIKDYPKGSILYFQQVVEPYKIVHDVEVKILEVFRKKYILVKGKKEWFEGNVYEMTKDIQRIINNYMFKINSKCK